MAMAKTFILGRITNDIEEKTTSSGKAVCSFNVAVDDKFDKERTHFIPCVAWGKTCQHIARWFGKGAMIAIDGNLQSRTYQAKDGTNRTVVEVVVENVSFTGEKRDRQQNSYQQENTQPISIMPQTNEFTEMPEDDDLPF